MLALIRLRHYYIYNIYVSLSTIFFFCPARFRILIVGVFFQSSAIGEVSQKKMVIFGAMPEKDYGKIHFSKMS